MRPVTLNQNDLRSSLAEIERASHENDVLEVSKNFTFDAAFTQQMQLLVSAPTLANTNAVLATLLQILQSGGTTRTT
jgi:hypothetical protein